ncbi:MAG: hypothetical protein V4709_08795 [Pseudomonadota bacterium]|jgi:hypothetical protein
MSTSFTVSGSSTFTFTHARHIAAKVATDLKRMQAFYGRPSDTQIATYEEEITVMLRYGCLDTVFYGFRRDGNWIEPMLKYVAHELVSASTADDDPGRVRPGANVEGASFYSFLTYSAAWLALPSDQASKIRLELPFQRETADAPAINGYLADDRSYSAGGRSLQRASLRSYT